MQNGYKVRVVIPSLFTNSRNLSFHIETINIRYNTTGLQFPLRCTLLWAIFGGITNLLSRYRPYSSYGSKNRVKLYL